MICPHYPTSTSRASIEKNSLQHRSRPFRLQLGSRFGLRPVIGPHLPCRPFSPLAIRDKNVNNSPTYALRTRVLKFFHIKGRLTTGAGSLKCRRRLALDTSVRSIILHFGGRFFGAIPGDDRYGDHRLKIQRWLSPLYGRERYFYILNAGTWSYGSLVPLLDTRCWWALCYTPCRASYSR